VHGPQRTRAQIVDEALRLLNVPESEREQFRKQVDQTIEAVILHGLIREPPRLRDLRDRLNQYYAALKKARRLAGRLSFYVGRNFIPQLEDEIAHIESTKAVLSRRKKEVGGRLWNYAGAEAAYFAEYLMQKRGLKPTKTRNGAWHCLTNLLFEAATGRKPVKNLFYYIKRPARDDDDRLYPIVIDERSPSKSP
jgi:hypothetical protein